MLYEGEDLVCVCVCLERKEGEREGSCVVWLAVWHLSRVLGSEEENNGALLTKARSHS